MRTRTLLLLACATAIAILVAFTVFVQTTNFGK
jgi:hypothetical protein